MSRPSFSSRNSASFWAGFACLFTAQYVAGFVSRPHDVATLGYIHKRTLYSSTTSRLRLNRGNVLFLGNSNSENEPNSNVDTVEEMREVLQSQEARKKLNSLLAPGDNQGAEKQLQEVLNFLEGDEGKTCGLSSDQAIQLLDILSLRVLTSGLEDDTTVEVTKQVYGELAERGLTRAFGSIDNMALPEQRRSVTQEILEEVTGLPQSALAPKSTNALWLAAGVSLVLAEMAIGNYLGFEAADTLIPATLAFFAADTLILNSVISNTIALAVVPGLKKRVIRHEAGHFLLAYLMGNPVQACLLEPVKLTKFIANVGQGGTLFTDPIFIEELSAGRLKKSTIDRFCVILMGGIAAEALYYGSAGGGSGDESQLIEILVSINPPWDIERIKTQARWAASQAVLLIKEHQACYDSLVDTLEKGGGLGECIQAIEEALPPGPLPSEVRSRLTYLVKETVLEKKKKEGDPDVYEYPTDYVDAEGREVTEEDFQALMEKTILDVKAGKSIMDAERDGGVWLKGLQAVKTDADLPPMEGTKALKKEEEPEKFDAERQLTDIDTKMKENESKLEEVLWKLKNLEK